MTRTELRQFEENERKEKLKKRIRIVTIAFIATATLSYFVCCYRMDKAASLEEEKIEASELIKKMLDKNKKENEERFNEEDYEYIYID